MATVGTASEHEHFQAVYAAACAEMHAMTIIHDDLDAHTMGVEELRAMLTAHDAMASARRDGARFRDYVSDAHE